jgi:hypothetical protein
MDLPEYSIAELQQCFNDRRLSGPGGELLALYIASGF